MLKQESLNPLIITGNGYSELFAYFLCQHIVYIAVERDNRTCSGFRVSELCMTPLLSSGRYAMV